MIDKFKWTCTEKKTPFLLFKYPARSELATPVDGTDLKMSTEILVKTSRQFQCWSKMQIYQYWRPVKELKT